MAIFVLLEDSVRTRQGENFFGLFGQVLVHDCKILKVKFVVAVQVSNPFT